MRKFTRVVLLSYKLNHFFFMDEKDNGRKSKFSYSIGNLIPWVYLTPKENWWVDFICSFEFVYFFVNDVWSL